MLGQNDNFRAFRDSVDETYGIDKGSYIISLVFNNQFTSLWNCSSKVEDNQSDQGVLLLYEIDPNLKPSLPVSTSKTDMMYNVSNEYTMCMLNISKWTGTSRYSS